MDNLEVIEKPKKKIGRPKGAKNIRPRLNTKRQDVREALRYHGPHALQVLIDVMNSGNSKVGDRIACAREVLNRAYGMPTKVIDAKLEVDVTVQFLDALKEINAKVIDEEG